MFAGYTRRMEPRTLRRIGNVCVAFGVLGLAFTVVVVVFAAAGATDAPATSMAIVIPVQSAVNVLAGWNLRRQAAAGPG